MLRLFPVIEILGSHLAATRRTGRLNGDFVLPTADELLQEQKTDMDQFLSSISESQPDITVSSEESVEVSVPEGKPYRPFQVTSLGSRSEPEGETAVEDGRLRERFKG